MILIAVPAAYAQQQGAVYEAQAGDCLSGIVNAHYPDVTGHFFVLHSNPDIVDENRIEVGQAIVLPGLTADQILPQVEQTGCNAASLTSRKVAKSAITEKATAAASVVGNPQKAEAASKATPVGDKPSVAEPIVAKIPTATETASNVVASTLPAQPKVKQASTDAASLVPAPSKQEISEPPVRQSIVTGTRAVPIDASQRTVAVAAQGRPTRATAPMPSKPQFAVDDESTMPSYRYRQSTPNRYVVNAIGARTRSASTALVQHPDQHFYVESRAEWQDAMSGHALEPSDASPTPVGDPTSKTTTPLEDTLAQREEPKTQRAGNIFIDESLLLKAAAKPGDNP